MNPATSQLHLLLEDLGRTLGFSPEREVDNSLLRVRLEKEKAYRPRIDLLWSLHLPRRQQLAISWAIGEYAHEVSHLPIVGIEVEGTTPTCKVMSADIANLCALGAPLGLLVVSEAGEKNIYRRATRVARSVRRHFGDQKVVPVEASWLNGLSAKRWRKGRCDLRRNPPATPKGGESRAWSKPTRQEIRKIGEDAGFIVVEPLELPSLDAEFDRLKAQWSAPMNETRDPVFGVRKPYTKSSEYFTESAIDIAWLMPMPRALPEFLDHLVGLDPGIKEAGLVFPQLWRHLTVVGFELESSSGKHAGGGLLNLSSHCVVGVVVTKGGTVAKSVKDILRTYQPTLGLRNVFVKAMS